MAFEVTPASVSEQPTLRAMIRATFTETPALAERCRDFSADRGLDSAQAKALWHVRPGRAAQMRSLVQPIPATG